MLVEIHLLILFVGSLVAFLITLEIGFRLGQRRQAQTDDPEKRHTTALQSATLGLLALLLAFSFSMGVERYGDRKAIIVDQANAIAGVEMRGRLLPAPQADRAGRLVGEYVQAWLDFRAAIIDVDKLNAADARATQIENELWDIAREMSSADPHSIPAGMFAAEVSDVVDLHEKRRRSIDDRVPEAVLLLLFGVSVLALGQVAYGSGLTGRRRPVANVLFACIIAVVLIVIMDIDRPRRGLIQVSQESMLRLQQSLQTPVAP